MSLAVNTIPTPYINVVVKRRKNTWYTVKDGNWSDPLVWESNAIRRWNYPGQSIPSPVFPQVGDDVYISHTVTLDTGSSTAPLTVNNLYVAGTLKSNNSIYLNVNGDLQCAGSVDFTSTDINLTLFGANNYIVNFTRGNSTIIYSRNGDQNVMNILYNNLTIANSFGTKYLAGDTTVNANVNIISGGTFDAYIYNLTVTGSTSVGGTFLKSGSGSLLFTGNLNSNRGLVDLSGGNPSIEFRGGYTSTFSLIPNFGTGAMNFTTNNQSFTNSNRAITLNNSVINIVGSISVTFDTTSAYAPSTSESIYNQINGVINGTVAGSTLINKGILWLSNTTAPMSTGVFDITTNLNNIVVYAMNANYTIPLTSYRGLGVRGTGTKTLTGNTTVNVLLTVAGSGTLDISTNTLTIVADAYINAGTINQEGGTLVFPNNVLSLNGSLTSSSSFTAEFRNGITNLFSTIPSNIALVFSTNNQTVNLIQNSEIDGSFTISGAITVTTGNYRSLTIKGQVNGNNAASTLDNRFNYLEYQNAVRPMLTGVLQTNAAANNFKYNLLGDQDVTGGTYRTLEFGGSGVKTLQGNIVVNTTAGGSWSITGSATINYNGYTITTI